MNPIIFTIGNFEMRWYSLFILLAAIAVFSLVLLEAKRFKISTDLIFNLLFWGLIIGVIGARLYYVIFNWSLYRNNLVEILEVWNGGLAIHGGIIAGLITVYIYTKKHDLSFLRMTDFIAVPLILAQAIGRWGNFFNSEAHGAATTYDWLYNFPASFLRNISFFNFKPFANISNPHFFHIPSFIIDGMKIDGVYYIPTFLFESIGCLVGFVFLILLRRSKRIHVGTLTGWYMVIYGIIRFFIEMTRTDALMIGAFKMAQIVSVLLIIAGIALLIYNATKEVFFDLYNTKEETTK